ncbi:MAG: thiamine-phosphate kinase [Polyangiaceae bacterium]|jgi:thiamine-monophosphate kinase
MNERERIAMLARMFDASGGYERAGIDTAIGDDAAVLTAGEAKAALVWTIDEQVEGTHFRRELLGWHDVGWRSFMAAASDVAAMGASPWCALCALSLPEDVDDEALRAIAAGQAAAACALRAPIVGGNLSAGATLSIATTLLGTCERPVLRRGARPGDGVWLAGHVGLASAGFRAIVAEREREKELLSAVDAWRAPRALVAQGVAMGALAHAAIDVSDGLARDVGHLAEASEAQFVLDAESLLLDALLEAAAGALRMEAIDLALYGGEDYALVVACPSPLEGFRRIGEVREGRGLLLRRGDEEHSIEAEGFDHFARSSSGHRRSPA